MATLNSNTYALWCVAGGANRTWIGLPWLCFTDFTQKVRTGDDDLTDLEVGWPLVLSN